MYRPTNMFGGSPLNRLSWLRTSHSFLNALIASPASRWILFKSGEPLAAKASDKQSVVLLSTNDVKPLLGLEPFFGQGKEAGQQLLPEHEGPTTEASRHLNTPIVFLGFHEAALGASAFPSSEFEDAEAAVAKLEGTPYFSIDVADLDLSPETMSSFFSQTEAGKAGAAFEWVEPRSLMFSLDPFMGGVFAQARSLVDWNQRNKVRLGFALLVLSASWTLILAPISVLSCMWLGSVFHVGWVEVILFITFALGG